MLAVSKLDGATVGKALASAWPEPRKKCSPRPSKLDPFTVKRIFGRLIDEHGMVDVSYQVVRTYVAARKPEIRIEAGRGPVNVFVPQSHRPCMEAEVDFGDEQDGYCPIGTIDARTACRDSSSSRRPSSAVARMSAWLASSGPSKAVVAMATTSSGDVTTMSGSG